MNVLVFSMLAKIILYPDHSDQKGCLDATQLTPSTGLHNWQLVAQNLTTGNLIDLLVCLDEFGFLNAEAESNQIV